MSVRSVIAVLGAITVIFFLTEALEVPTIAILAEQRPADMDAYMAARSEPAVLAGRAGIAVMVGLLGGYLAAKVAGQYEMQHALAAVVLQAVMMLRGFAAEPPAAASPLWARLGLVTIVGIAMMVGAAVRARAARLSSSTEDRS